MKNSNFKRLRTIATYFLACLILVNYTPDLANADWFSFTNVEDDKSLAKDQKINLAIDQALEKGRKVRAEHNYNSARGYGKKALRLDPNSRMAKAFLEQLDIEEARWKAYQETLKKRKVAEKEEAKLKKQEAKIKKQEVKRQEALSKKQEVKKDVEVEVKVEREGEVEEEVKVEEQVAVVEDKDTGIVEIKEKEEIEVERVPSAPRVIESAPTITAQKPAPAKKLTEKEIYQNAEKIASLLENAEKELENKDYDKARDYIKQALKVDENASMAKIMLEAINETQAAAGRGEDVEFGAIKEKVKAKADGQETSLPMGEGAFLKMAKPGQPIIVDGDKVEYFEEDGKIVAEGNVEITYGEVKLTCDRIEVNTQSRQALCEGNVRIEQADGLLTGDRIRYDFNRKLGEIIGGEVSAFPWFGQAEETGKVGANEYLLRNGFITTCDLDEPHYRVKAKEIRVFPNEKVIAKNVSIYLGKIPVLWFPYYYHPVIQTKAKVQFIPGVKSEWGYFLLSAWRFHIKGNTKADVLSDYRSKKGFAGGFNLYYDLADFWMDGLGEGTFRAYFVNQNGWGTYEPTEFRGDGTKEKWRNRIQWNHRIEFDPTTIGMIELNKYSDEYFLKDYLYNEYEESSQVPPNYVSVISSQTNYTVSLLANKRFNDFYTVTERLPELKMNIPDQRLWDLPLYYTSEISATNFEKQYKDDLQANEKTQRLDSFQKLSYVTGIGPLNIVPYGIIQNTFYTETRWDRKPTFRTAFSGGVDTFMRFHKVYDVVTDALGLDINGLRHIIVPKANYFHRHQPTVDKDNLYQMDVIDSLEKENYVELSLENKFQTKRGGKTVDLVRSNMSVDYHFVMKKKSFDFEDGGQFRNLKFEIELRPYDWFYIDGDMEISTKNQALKTGNIEIIVTPWDSLQMALGYRYEKDTPESRNQVTFDMSYRINPKWRIGIYERFDIENGGIAEQQFSITRDLHCWEVDLMYDVEGGNFMSDDYTFWLAFKIKAFPDFPIGLSRSFDKRIPGAMDQPVK